MRSTTDYRWISDDAKAALLIVHGLGEHAGRWSWVGEQLCQQGLAVYAYDQIGHGRRTGPHLDITDFDDYVRELDQRVEALGQQYRQVFLYGHSMGGLIALRYALNSPEKLKGLILSAPALAAEVPWYLRAAARVYSIVWPSLRLQAPITAEQLSRDPAVSAAYFSDPHVYTHGTARHAQQLLQAMDATRSRVTELTVPTLVLHGSDDTLVPPAASSCLEGISCVRREVLPTLRHELHNEPEKHAVLRRITDWVEENLQKYL